MKKGSVLNTVLWMLLIMGIVAMRFLFEISAEETLIYTENKEKLLLNHVVTYSSKIIDVLEANDKKTFMNPAASWWSGADIYKNYEIGNFYFYCYNNHYLKYNQELVYGLEDYESRININTADENVLRTILRDNFSNNETENIIIYKYALLNDIMDVEKFKYYKEYRKAFGGNVNLPFISLNDFLYSENPPIELKQSDSLMYQNLTVYSSGKVNLNTANKTVMTALGLTESEADKIIQDRTYGNPITSISDLTQSDPPIVNPLTIQRLMKEDLVALKSSNFVLNIWAVNKNRDFLKKFRVRITRNSEGNFEISEINIVKESGI